MRLRLDVEDQPLEVEPEVRVGDRELTDLAALRDDQVSRRRWWSKWRNWMPPERPLAEAVVEQQPERDPVAKLVVRGEERSPDRRAGSSRDARRASSPARSRESGRPGCSRATGGDGRSSDATVLRRVASSCSPPASHDGRNALTGAGGRTGRFDPFSTTRKSRRGDRDAPAKGSSLAVSRSATGRAARFVAAFTSGRVRSSLTGSSRSRWITTRGRSPSRRLDGSPYPACGLHRLCSLG